MTAKAMVFAGTSVTINGNTWSYPNRTKPHLVANESRYQWTFYNAARSGNNTWSNLVRMSNEILAYSPDVVIFDTANDNDEDWQKATLEAFIRRLLSANPQMRIAAFNFFAVADQNVNANVNTPTNQAAIESAEALYAHYGVTLLDYWGTIQERVNNEAYNLNEYMDDTIHPNQTGHDEAYDLLLPHLPFNFPLISLPARLYDDGTLENESTMRDGNANDGETGTWSAAGTRGRQSSTAGSTIAFNGVSCSTIGAWRDDFGLSANLEISVDGGAFYNFTLYQNGGALNEGFGTHDIIIRLKSGGSCRIDEFWAV